MTPLFFEIHDGTPQIKGHYNSIKYARTHRLLRHFVNKYRIKSRSTIVVIALLYVPIRVFGHYSNFVQVIRLSILKKPMNKLYRSFPTPRVGYCLPVTRPHSFQVSNYRLQDYYPRSYSIENLRLI